MKFAFVLLTTLLCVPMSELRAASPKGARIVIASEAGAKLDSDVATAPDRSALRAFMEARAGIVNPRGMRGWPEGTGYLTMSPTIERLQIQNVTAGGLEHLLDHSAGVIEALDLSDIVAPESTKTVHSGGDAKILRTRGPAAK